jgi:hypothetical protein
LKTQHRHPFELDRHEGGVDLATVSDPVKLVRGHDGRSASAKRIIGDLAGATAIDDQVRDYFEKGLDPKSRTLPAGLAEIMSAVSKPSVLNRARDHAPVFVYDPYQLVDAAALVCHFERVPLKRRARQTPEPG